MLMIFLKKFLWPNYSGAPGARGPRFIEPPEPPVHTPLGQKQSPLVFWKNDADVSPDVALLARVYLTPSALSVPVEGLFSVTEII